MKNNEKVARATPLASPSPSRSSIGMKFCCFLKTEELERKIYIFFVSLRDVRMRRHQVMVVSLAQQIKKNLEMCVGEVVNVLVIELNV
jgi:hypothetical protein